MARHRRITRFSRTRRATDARPATGAQLAPIAANAWVHCPDGTTIPVQWARGRRLGQYEVRVPPATPVPPPHSLIQIRHLVIGVIYSEGIAS